MQKEKFIIISNKKELKLYEEYNFNIFILPLKDYSIGFDVYYDIDEINEISNKHEIYVLANRLLHMDIYKFKELYPKFNKNIKFIIEDIGLTNIIDKDRLVLWENHILSNYKAINYLDSLGIKNVVINNDLTINELKTIIKECNTNIFYNYISKNMLMYSRIHLVSNFNKYYDIRTDKKDYLLDENVTHKELLINETEYGSVVRYNKIFCASKYIEDLKSFNLIIDFTNIDDINEKMILENYNQSNLCNLIDSDYYFLENEIKYKVGDLK